MKFALQRKTGYISPYHLGMVYPSYRKGVFYQGSKGEWVAPILVQFSDNGKWFRVWPWLVRFPGWCARKAQNLDKNGQVKR